MDMFTRQIFGQKTEQTRVPVPGQSEFTLDTQVSDAAQTNAENGEIETAPIQPAQPAKKKGGSQKGRKTRAQLLPDHLPVEQTEIIPVAVQQAPEQYRRIGEEVVDKLERTPAKVIILRLVRPKYVKIDEPYSAPIIAPKPPALIEGGFFGNEMLLDLALGKYLYHQPLYRQAKAYEWESGVILSAATMCQAIAQVSELVAPIVREMSLRMWQTNYVQIDLTPVRCLSKEHAGGSFLGQMWVTAAVGGDVIYTWDQSKEAIVAERIIPEDYAGKLQCDGGSEILCYLKGGKSRKKPPPDILRFACWAHVRRKFETAAKSGCPHAKRIMKIINVLYRIEHDASKAGLSPAARQELRNKRARRVLTGLHRRLLAIFASVRPRSAVGAACSYTLNQWSDLLRYVEHGEVEIDNNWVENAIRPCALGKKNYLFIGDVGAGQRSANLYSLMGSCLRRGINPRNYLRWVFEKLPGATNQTVSTLTPAAYAAAQATEKAPPVPAAQAA
ncbi:MAG: IS66 family transposase [Verrucomicrobiaceae bacterium]